MNETGNANQSSTTAQKWAAVLLAIVAIAVVSIALLGWAVVTVLGASGRRI